MEPKIIRDNVHGDIRVCDQVIIDLIDTPEFQRLRRIIQLGGEQYAFIGATHTRFAHCVGVYNVVCRFLDNPEIANALSEHDQITVKVAGLLHDIGHGPFSHSFEKISPFKHESYSSAIITDNTTSINQILKKHNLDPTEIANIIEGHAKNKILGMMVSSQLDADRLDYLARDSVNAGVNYAKLDIDWIIRHAMVRNEKIVYHYKTIYAIESYLLGRYHMYRQIYTHKVSYGFDATLKMWFKRFYDLATAGFHFKNAASYTLLQPLVTKTRYTASQYTQLDDFSFTHLIKLTCDEEDDILSDLARRLINRHFLENYGGATEDEIKNKLLENNFNPEYYLVIEEVKPMNIYTVDGAKDDEIFIVERDGNLSRITELSSVLRAEDLQKDKKMLIVPKF